MSLIQRAQSTVTRFASVAFALIVILAQTQPIPAAAADLLAPDDVAFNVGYGSHVDVFGLAASWKYTPMIRALDRPNLDTRLIAQLAYWYGRERPTLNPSVWDVGLMPMLRWTALGEAATRPFVEGGIGINLLSSTRINNDRVFSTAFQFGEQAGIGATFGAEKKYALEVYIQHVSNGNIKKPNDGLTNGGLLFRVSLR